MDLAHTISTTQLNALGLLANNGGNVKRTAEQLGMGRKTLTNWRDQWASEYTRIREAMAEQTESQIIASIRENTQLATENLGLALGLVNEQLEDGSDSQPATTAQRMAVIMGIGSEKTRMWTERPTEIVQHQPADIEEDLRALRAKAITVEVVEETAEPAD